MLKRDEEGDEVDEDNEVDKGAEEDGVEEGGVEESGVEKVEI
jgi:hypothetical protein